MKYTMSGADIRTGANRSLDVEAASKEEAIQIANKHGVYPEVVQAAKPSEVPRRASRTPIVVIVLILLICSGVINIPWRSSMTHPEPRNDPQPVSSFASDKDQLEWRSKNHLPMTDEDVKYEQGKVLRAEKMLRDSETPVGH
jgi:hypothetical protein